MRQSYISRTVWPTIIKFCENLHTCRLYNHTGYDVTLYFRSEVIGVRKTADNGSERFVRRRKNRNFPKSLPIAIKLCRLVALAELSSKIYISCAHARARPQRRFEIAIFDFSARLCPHVRQARAAICYDLRSQPSKVSLAPTLPFWRRS